MSDNVSLSVPRFWFWLFHRASDNTRGISNIFNKWIWFHLIVAAGLSITLASPSSEIARYLALPGASALIGLAFGWAGRSASLLQDKDFSKFIIENGAPAEGYVYSFQLAVLTLLIFIGVALVMASGGLPITSRSLLIDDILNRFLLFFVGSIAVREAWGTVDFVNKLTIQFYRKREIDLASDRSSSGLF